MDRDRQNVNRSEARGDRVNYNTKTDFCDAAALAAITGAGSAFHHGPRRDASAEETAELDADRAAHAKEIAIAAFAVADALWAERKRRGVG